MEFGVFTQLDLRVGRSEHEAFREVLDLASVCDDLGIDCYWLAEFHFRPHTPLSAPMVLASNVAARTKRINVGLAVQVLPLSNPLHLAEECATLDHLSEGRFVYGIGRSSFLDSYQGYNVDYELSRPMFFEALQVMTRAWGAGPFSYAGDYYSYTDVNVVPKPYRAPHPPLRIACESRASFDMMGNLGFPIMIRHQMEVPELQILLAGYEAQRHEAGFPGANQVTLQTTAYLAETGSRARSEAEASTWHERRMRQQRVGREGDAEAQARLGGSEPPYEELIQRRLYGSPAEVSDRLQEYEETLGITGVSLNVNPGGQIPYEQVVNSLRLLADEVMPRFK